MTTIPLLYELVGTDDRRMSPFCWRTKLCLAHKGLEFDTVPLKFSEKHKLTFSGQEQVPVLVDNEKTISDSWTIACYLDKTYSQAADLFAGLAQQNLSRVFNHWFDDIVTLSLFPLMVPDNFDVVCPEDMSYYTESRFKWLGKTREELLEERTEECFVAWRKKLEPLREILATQEYLGGDTPLYVDYIAFSTFMWARAVSPWPVIKPDDVIYDWRERMLDLYDGLARKSKGYDY